MRVESDTSPGSGARQRFGRLNVPPGEINERLLAQTNPASFLFRFGAVPTVVQDSMNPPQRADACGRSTVNHKRTVFFGPDHSEKLLYLRRRDIGGIDGNNQILESHLLSPLSLQSLTLRILLRSTQVKDGPDTLLSQTLQVLDRWLPGKAYFSVQPHEVDGGDVILADGLMTILTQQRKSQQNYD
jgi:hypothetical protein